MATGKDAHLRHMKRHFFQVGRRLTDDEWADLREWKAANPNEAFRMGDDHPTDPIRGFKQYSQKGLNGEVWALKTYLAGRKEYLRKYCADNKERLIKINKIWVEANREHVRDTKRAWVAANPEKEAAAKAKWAAANRDKVLAKQAEYREINRESLRINGREKARRMYKENPERILAASARWRQRNPDYHKAWHDNNKPRRRLQRSQRLKTDPLYALDCRCRSRIIQAFKAKRFPKTAKTSELLGCDWPTLASHIESRFLPGMTWENRHLWHVDHIIPCASAKTEAELLALFHYTNLQPLWAPDNLRKGAKVPA